MALSFAFDATKGETPETIKRKRDLVRALMGAQRAPQNVGEGLSALGDGIVANVLNSRAEKAEQAGLASANAAMQGIFPDFPAAPAASGGAASADMTGNDVFSSFMDTVKQGGVDNPYALAAIAATGKRESAFSPKNAGRTWADGANNAGGIMSWNGPRLANLMAFAKQNGEQGLGSPKTQASFFLQENPDLIKSLGSAKSVDEAIGLMNNAWRFAGYNRPGGEAAARLAAAQGFLPQFQGGGQSPAAVAAIERAAPTQVASMDPSIGYTPVQAAPNAPPAVGQPQAAQVAQAVQPQAVPPMAGGPAPARSGPTVQELMKAAQNPWLNDGQRAVVGALLKQRMEQDDPKRQLEMQNMQLEQEKMRLEIELARNPQMSPYERAQIEQRQQELQAQQNKLLEVSPGTTIFDPQKREPIYTAPAKADVPSAVQEYQFAVSQGFPGTFQDWEASKKGGMSFQTNPDGTVTFQQGANIKPLTEGQSKDTVFATRAEGSLPLIDKYGGALTSLGESVGGQTPVVGNYLKSPEFQQAEQAGKEFLQAILRKDTGAAITPAETNEYGSVYLPRPGDSKELLEQKRLSRLRALEALKAGMPPQAILQQEKALANTNKAQTPPSDGPAQPKTDDEYNALPSGALFIDPDDGKTYRKP